MPSNLGTLGANAVFDIIEGGCAIVYKTKQLRSLTIDTEICIFVFMKTTLDINDSLLANAKALAARQRTSLTRLIEEGLQLRLRSSRATAKASKRKIPVFNGRGGMVAGVNPGSNKAMLDAADDDA
jgi:Family of unknown function (DUF6364)